MYNTYKNTTIGLERKHKSLFSSIPKNVIIVWNMSIRVNPEWLISNSPLQVTTIY